MAFLAPVLPYISGALSIFQGISGLRAGQANAAAAKAEGEQAVLSSQAEAGRIRRQTDFTQSRFRAQVGAQGSTFEGSPFLAYLENAKQGELEAQDALFAGQLRKRAKKMEAANFRREGSAAFFGGLAKGGLSLASTILKDLNT